MFNVKVVEPIEKYLNIFFFFPGVSCSGCKGFPTLKTFQKNARDLKKAAPEYVLLYSCAQT